MRQELEGRLEQVGGDAEEVQRRLEARVAEWETRAFDSEAQVCHCLFMYVAKVNSRADHQLGTRAFDSKPRSHTDVVNVTPEQSVNLKPYRRLS